MCKNKDLCGIEIPSEKYKILKSKQRMKSEKMPYIINADVNIILNILQQQIR